MDKNIPPCAAKGKFPYPHRNLRQVAHAAFLKSGGSWTGKKFADWLVTYHG